ncbi:hypothetical protein EVAR_96722_1 [Eumeta japonica]|uniref:Uncharacterized protein n=1 Tax=Eumeta variegata TaxID=151549 RepID=A0A4C1WK48_EUMVA|nr:hypothetical protein EVAR_96722_1 [Eumeta japonica]
MQYAVRVQEIRLYRHVSPYKSTTVYFSSVSNRPPSCYLRARGRRVGGGPAAFADGAAPQRSPPARGLAKTKQTRRHIPSSGRRHICLPETVTGNDSNSYL